LASCRVKTRPKIIQDSEVFDLKLEDASLAAIFFALIESFIVQMNCVQSPVGKGCFFRVLLSHEKSSEGALYSVPSFGGHVAISHNVVMAQTVPPYPIRHQS